MSTDHFVNRISQLSKAQRKVLEKLLGERGSVTDQPSKNHGPINRSAQLIAFVVPSPDGLFDSDDVREELSDRLPSHMVPSRIIVVDSLPTTATGKLDRKALAAYDAVPAPSSPKTATPESEIENSISKVWQQVLALDIIGTHDNFFELGGDSILTIQIIARLRKAGIRLTPKDFLDNPTIADQARVATAEKTTQPENVPVAGPTPMTAIQHWFFEQEFEKPGHWNQNVMLELPHGVLLNQIRTALDHVVNHHPSLRARFFRTPDGWRQSIDETSRAQVFEQDLSHVADENLQASVEKRATELQSSFDLEVGGLVRAVLFNDRSRRRTILLLAIHHLVVDAVSIPIVVEDLESAWRQIEQGESVSLPRATLSASQWSTQLADRVRSITSAQAEERWRRPGVRSAPDIPIDPSSPRRDTEAYSRSHTISLSKQETSRLVEQAPRAFRITVDEILIAALVGAIASSMNVPRVTCGLESHGRPGDIEGVDLSRTVGWLTSFFPLTIEAEDFDDPGSCLRAVKEELRSIPHLGTEFGAFHYLAQETGIKKALEGQKVPEIVFTNLGRVSRSLQDSIVFKPVNDLPFGAHRAPQNHRSFLLEITAVHSLDRIHFTWSYGCRQFSKSSIQALAETFETRLQQLVSHCLRSDTSGYSPSDFPEANLSQDTLESLLSKIRSSS